MNTKCSEDVFKQHRAEIDAMFDERGLFRRLGDMFSGLAKPKNSREYKIARTEVQRLVAPLVAVLLPVIGVMVLIVVTAVSGQMQEHITVDVAQLQDDEAELDDTPDPPEEEIDMTQDIDVTVDVQTDVPTPDMAMPAPPAPDPGGEPNKVAAAPSPVVMSAVSGTVKMRGLGDGTSGGFGRLIGSGGKSQNIDGCLVGIIIDFKNNSDGSPRPEYNMNQGYWDDAKSLFADNFSPKSLSKFFVPPKRVALNHFFIKIQPAANGPKAFGVDNVMKPSGFVAYYSGSIKSDKRARYRFVGCFDDTIVVRINHKAVLEDNCGHRGEGTCGLITGWSSTSPDNRKWKFIEGGVAVPLTIGDWFDVAPGKELFVELLVGERPGGYIGGVLLIQKEGEKYETANGGRPLLPIFATRPLSFKEREDIIKNGYPMSVESPRFNVRPQTKMRSITKDDVSVKVDI